MSALKVFSPLLVSGSVKAPAKGDGTVSAAGPTVPMLKDGNLFGHGLKRSLHFKWDFNVDGGTIGAITLNSAAGGWWLPANALVVFNLLNSPTAPVGAGASISFGTTAGSSATSLKASTAITSFTIDAIVAGATTGVAANAFKMSAAGQLTMTVSAANLTAGLIEGWIEYYEPANA